MLRSILLLVVLFSRRSQRVLRVHVSRVAKSCRNLRKVKPENTHGCRNPIDTDFLLTICINRRFVTRHACRDSRKGRYKFVPLLLVALSNIYFSALATPSHARRLVLLLSLSTSLFLSSSENSPLTQLVQLGAAACTCCG